MIRASVQVRDTKNAFSITVCAKNLQRAVEFAADRYPGHAVSLQFPLDPEAFFVEGSGLETEPFALVNDQRQQRQDERNGAHVERRRWNSATEAATGKAVR